MRSGDIKNILRRAKNRPPGFPEIYINIIRVLILLLLAAAVVFSFYIKGARTQLAEQAEELEKERVRIEVKNKALEAEIARLKELLIYRGVLKIQGLRITNRGGELQIAGEIKNHSARGVNDIELTAYFLGNEGTPVHEVQYMAKSHDGRPLYKGQRRRFKFTVNPAPEEAEDISLIITRIEF